MINEDALKRILSAMYRSGISKEGVQDIYRFLKKSKPESLVFQNPNFIAVHLNLSRIEILNLVVVGVMHGLFEMQWDVNCPHCGSIAEHTHTLGEVHTHDFCQSCQVDFDNYADQNITVSVSLHPDLFKDGFPKSPEPRKIDERVQPVKALDLIGIPEFRKHFSNQIPKLDHSVKIRSVTLMFTDLIHSTALYNEIGDIKAYAFVKEHFDLLFSEILSHTGGIIKTIGDAVMAVFSETGEAISVAHHVKQQINHLLDEHQLQDHYGLKVGISSGPALVVNMNDQIDLFGSTVNRSARVVSFSSKNTIAITEELLADTAIQNYLNENHIRYETVERPLKGFPGLNKIFILNID